MAFTALASSPPKHFLFKLVRNYVCRHYFARNNCSGTSCWCVSLWISADFILHSEMLILQLICSSVLYCSCQSGSLNFTIDLSCSDSLCIIVSLAHLRQKLLQVSVWNELGGAARPVVYLHRLYSMSLYAFTSLGLLQTAEFKRTQLSGREMLHNEEARWRISINRRRGKASAQRSSLRADMINKTTTAGQFTQTLQ